MEEDIKMCIEVLRKGGLILYPTDTIWGIGCDATNAGAVRRVYELKRRADSKAMLVLLDDASRLERYVDEVPDVAYQLIEAAVTPLTIIYDRGRNLAPALLGDDGSVGVRVTGEAFTRQLCRRFGRPIVSTSANVSGEPSAPTFARVSEEIKQGVDYVVRYRQDDEAEARPSGIIKLRANGEFKILRK